MAQPRILLLFALLILFFVSPSICEATSEGRWELVDIKSGKAIHRKEQCNEHYFTPSKGSFSYRTRYFQGVCNQRNEETFSTRSTWTPPPTRLNPGEVKQFTITATRGSNIPGLFLSNGISVSIDKPGCLCGGVCGGYELGRAVASSRIATDTVQKVVQFKVPAGSRNGSFALRFCPAGWGYAEGFCYIYKWVDAEQYNDGSTGRESKAKAEPETTEYTWSDYAKDFEERCTPEQQAEAIARLTPEQRAELERARAELKRAKKTDTGEDEWAEYAEYFENLGPEDQVQERRRLTPEQQVKLDRVRTKLKAEKQARTTEYTWSDYARDFKKLSPEEQTQERARLTSEQQAELDRLLNEPRADGKAPDAATAEDTAKDESTQPVSSMTRQEFLWKEWDFWLSEYRSLEDDLITRSPDANREKMEQIKLKLERIKKTYEKEFGHPFPETDSTLQTRYPPQTPRQQEALKIYEAFKRVSEAHKEAAEREADIINRLRETPILNTREDRESREAATRRKEALEEQLKQIKQDWDDNNFHADWGPLRTRIIPDPQHQPLDPRKDRRQVDALEYKIKGGARFEGSRTQNGT